MQLNTYLLFKGNCEEAFRFYETALGGKIESMMTYKGSPAEKQTAPEFLQKIMHARLVAGDAVLMGSDDPHEKIDGHQGFTVAVHTDDPAEAERIFHALEKGANVTLPIQATFWALKFGMLVDRFGIPWMVNCQQAAQGASS
jgi:PhnB protein